MISAGTVETKKVGMSFTANTRPGIAFLTSTKFGSSGSCANAAGSWVTGDQLARTLLRAANHAPLLSQYQVLSVESLNTSQLVFTANERVVPVIGASTGS